MSSQPQGADASSPRAVSRQASGRRWKSSCRAFYRRSTSRAATRSVPVANPHIVRCGPALTGLGERLEAHQERRPLGAAVFGELDRLAPVAVTEANDGVLALLRELKDRVRVDPLGRAFTKPPAHA